MSFAEDSGYDVFDSCTEETIRRKQMEYLNNIGAFKGIFNQVIAKEATQKTKAAYYLEFKDEQGRVCSMRFNKPLGAYDPAKLAKVMRVFQPSVTKEHVEKAPDRALEALKQHQGKPVVFFVEANKWKDKTFFQVFNVIGADNAQYLELSSTSSADPFASNSSNPLEQAMDAFGLEQEDSSNIPF